MRRLTLLILGLCTACDSDNQQPAPEPTHPDLVVRTLDIEVSRGEFDRWTAYMRSYYPQAGAKLIARRILDDLLTVRLAEREFAEARKAAHTSAQALAKVARNSIEFSNRTELMQDRISEGQVRRLDLPIQIEHWLFDQTHVLAVSEPIAVTQGYQVVVATDYLPSETTPLSDSVQAKFATFFTEQEAETAAEWLHLAKRRLRAGVQWLHPDYKKLVTGWRDG